MVLFDFVKDLEYWEKNIKEFWDKFTDTTQIVIPDRLRDWLVGQEKAYNDIKLHLYYWVKKVKWYLEQEKKKADRKVIKQFLKERPGPFILMVGPPGCGKSLIIKILAEELKELYEKEGIGFPASIIATRNKVNTYKPHIHYVKPPENAKKMIALAQEEEMKRGALKSKLLKYGLMLFVIIGIFVVGIGFNVFFDLLGAGEDFRAATLILAQYLAFSSSLFMVGIFGWWWTKGGGFGGWGGYQDIVNIPNLLVDNDPKTTKLYVDATGVNETKLCGDIEWSPLGEKEGLAKPFHRRIVAGDVHKAHLKLLYIDEIKRIPIHIATELLTIMEDGEAPIKAHPGLLAGGTTAALSGETEPLPALFMLIGAGNEDVLTDPNSILNLLPAFKNRFRYGGIIYLDNEVEATVRNELKMIQAFADEIKRLGLLPFNKDAVRCMLNYTKILSTHKGYISLRFREVIQALLRSSEIAWSKGKEIVEFEDVDLAIREYCKGAGKQMMEVYNEKIKPYKLIKNSGVEIGVVNGLAVVNIAGDLTGTVTSVSAYLSRVDNPDKASFKVTGIAKSEEATIKDSVECVKTAIKMLYGIDLEKEYYCHISFNQSSNVEGTSAGITMTLAIMSLLGDPRIPINERKPIPIRQDFAVTGTIEILKPKEGDIQVGAIGGVIEKIEGAEGFGIYNVILPKENYETSLTEESKKYIKAKVYGASTVMEYFDLIRGDKNG